MAADGYTGPDGYATTSYVIAALAPYALIGHTHAAVDLSPYALKTYVDTGDAAVLYTASLAYDLASNALPKIAPLVTNSTFTVSKLDGSAGARWRATGGAVDFDLYGEMVVSAFSAVGFTGTQTGLMRWRGNGVSVAGDFEIGATSIYANDSRIRGGVDATLGGKNSAVPLNYSGYLTGTGAPAAETWALNDLLIRDDGVWRCSVAGTPGTWVKAV